jgi:hypothetical protein
VAAAPQTEDDSEPTMGVGWKYSIKSLADAGVEAPSRSPNADTGASVTATVWFMATPRRINRE